MATIGAGAYLDPEVGSAGVSGDIRAHVRRAGAQKVVDFLRQGRSPEEAGMEVLKILAHGVRNDPRHFASSRS